MFDNSLIAITYAGVTEEQFKETWTRPGAMDIDEGNVVVAKARM